MDALQLHLPPTTVGLVESRAECVAIDGRDAGRSPEYPRPRGPVRRMDEAQVVDQLGLHGLLRLRGHPHRVGVVGLPHGVWYANAPPRWLPEHRTRHQLPARPVVPPRYRSLPAIPASNDGVFPVCLRRHYRRPNCRLFSGPHELRRLDDLRPVMDHLLLCHRGLQHLGWRLSLPDGRD